MNDTPRATLKEVTDDAVATAQSVQYHHFPETTTVVCAIKLLNGFVVVGKASCLDPNEFDYHMGRDIAYDDAVNNVMEALAYPMRTGFTP